MIGNPMRRVAAILLTAMMLFSTIIVVMPQDTVSAASETNDITIKVLDSKYNSITTATVKYTEVHNGTTFFAIYDAGTDAFHTWSSVPSGSYRIDVSAPRYYSQKNITGFRFDGRSAIILDTVTLIKFGTDANTLTITVTGSGGNPITGASVKLYNMTMMQFVNSSTTNASGQVAMKTFGGAKFNLTVSAQNYAIQSIPIGEVNSPESRTVKLNDSVLVYREVKRSTGTGIQFASNVISYLYNRNTSLPLEIRILRATGSSVRFDAYAGNWMLVIDGSNVDPCVKFLNLTTTDSIDLNVLLANQNQSREDRTITWSSWNTMTVVTDSIWNQDKTYPGLDYADIGCLRAQIDLAIGNADGYVSNSEYIYFNNEIIQNHNGPDWVTTSTFMHAEEINGKNKTQYVTTTVNSIGITNPSVIAEKYITVNSSVMYESTVVYMTQTTLLNDAGFYQILFNTPFDSISMNRSYELDLVNGYEMTFNVSENPIINGYTVITVDPQLSLGSHIAENDLSIGKSVAPVAKGEVKVTGATNAYVKTVDGNVSYYIVKMDSNVTFSSERTTDANGNNLLTYNWSWGDGLYNVTKTKTFVHNYTAAANCTVVLNVTDVVGKYNETTFNVRVDGYKPRPAITVMYLNDTVTTSLTIDQGTSLKFSPWDSEDDLYASGDGEGVLSSYDSFTWQVGNNAPEAADSLDPNMTHEFVDAGKIRVVLNVTDVVGYSNNKTIWINVSDKQAPVVNLMKVLNSTWGVTLIERSLIYFDAKDTTDNIDNATNMDFNWTFGDGSAKKSGAGLYNVTHVFSSYGQYKVVLNVTDAAKNNLSISQMIYVGMGDRPNVYPDKVSFSPTTFEEGVSGRITVNLTNQGSKIAKNITIEVWWYSGTIAQKRIGNISMIYDANGTLISNNTMAKSQSGYAYLDWTPDAKGNYSIRAIVNSTDQPTSNWASGYVEVKEAGWKGIAIPVFIIILVVAIPLIMLARRRIGSMGSMRRPKKEKEEKK